MGVKNDKMTPGSSTTAEDLLANLSGISGITSKKMFGGYGIFHEGKMFGMVDSKGNIFMKADDSNRVQFEKAGSTKHSKMPYYSVSDAVLDDIDTLEQWAQSSIDISK